MSISTVLRKIRMYIKSEEIVNGRLVLAYFADIAPEMDAECMQLEIAYNRGIMNDLFGIAKNSTTQLSLIDMGRLVNRLERVGLSSNVAKSLVEEIWLGMGEHNTFENHVDTNTIVNISFNSMMQELPESLLPDPEFEITKNHKLWDIYERAINGDDNAQNKLGDAYFDGEFVKQNLEEAVKWYGLSAGQNNAEGLNKLSYMYAKGIGGCRKNLSEAHRLCLQSAKIGGYAAALYNVGWNYEMGEGVGQNYTEAFNWYMRAAEMNCSEAMVRIAYMFYCGLVDSRDVEPAKKWLLEAKNLGNEVGKECFELICFNDLQKEKCQRRLKDVKEMLDKTWRETLQSTKKSDNNKVYIAKKNRMDSSVFKLLTQQTSRLKIHREDVIGAITHYSFFDGNEGIIISLEFMLYVDKNGARLIRISDIKDVVANGFGGKTALSFIMKDGRVVQTDINAKKYNIKALQNNLLGNS